MCLPSLDYVKTFFPYAKIHAIVSPRTREFLMHVSSIDAVHLYEKKWDWREKLRFSLSLRKKYQAVFDFKHSVIPLFVAPFIRTSLVRRVPGALTHKKDRYLYLTRRALPEKRAESRLKNSTIVLEEERKKYWDDLFKTRLKQKAVSICYASNADKKNYPLERFVQICEALKSDYPLFLVGRKEDASKGEKIMSALSDTAQIMNLTGQTQLWELWYIFQRYTGLVIGNDSGIIHLASYLNIKTIGIFGPTSPAEFGPWSDYSRAIVPQERCARCKGTACVYRTAKCLYAIEPERVVQAAREMLAE